MSDQNPRHAVRWVVLLAVLIISSSPFSITSQAFQRPQCTEITAPELRGLRLGMTPDEVLRIYPFAEIKSEDYGQSETLISTFGTPNNERLRGLQYLSLKFVDGKLAYISVSYKSDVTWPNLSDFTKQVSKSLGLPDVWRKRGEIPLQASLTCNGFELSALSLNRHTIAPVLTLQDLNAKNLVEGRRKQIEQKKRDGFRP